MSISSFGVVAHLVGVNTNGNVTPLRLLSQVADGADRVDGLASGLAIERTTVYRMLEPLLDWNFVERPESGVVTITGLGAVLLTHFQETIPSDAVYDPESVLAYLCGSESRTKVFRSLRDAPADKAALAAQPGMPSPITIYRVLDRGLDTGLIVRSMASGQYSLTNRGEELLEILDRLVQGVEVAQRHAVLFRCVGPAVATIPLLALHDARQIINHGVTPDQTALAMAELVEEGVSKVQGLRSFVSIQLADTFWPAIESGAQYESIITPKVLYNLPLSGRYYEMVRYGLQAPNVSVRVVPALESFPYGLSILNGDTVILGPALPGHVITGEDGLTSETIITQAPEMLTWAEMAYESYRRQSHSPLAQIAADFADVFPKRPSNP